MGSHRHARAAALGLLLLAALGGCGDAEVREAVGSHSMAAKGSKATVTITSPASGATVSGAVSFGATASSSAGISYVDFYIDGALAFHDTAAPYSYPWDTALTPDGSHTLLARATPTSGTPASHQISVLVSNAPPPPPPAYTIGGTASGLSGTVVLQNNGGDYLSLSANGDFTFAGAVGDGAGYDVTVLSQPTGQTCTVANGAGTVAGADVTSVAVSCADNAGEGIQIKLASFNIENFGESKSGKPAVMDVLVNIALRYDILLMQELTNIPDSSDNTGPVIRQFLSEINQASGNQYAMAVSPRVGDAQPEQYVIIYRTQKVSILEATLYSDPANDFVRPPALTRVQVGDETFYISNVHTAPDFAQSEIYAQTDVAHAVDGTDPDIILLGDWNSDGSYFNENTEWPGFGLLGEGYQNRIGDVWDTTVLSTVYTYDRIMLSPSLLDNDLPGSAAPFYFDDPQDGGWDMTPILTEGCSLGYLACDATYQDAARRVSDHYPVEITLQFGGTIAPPPPPPPPPPAAYSTSFEVGEPDFQMVSGAGTFYPDTCPAGTSPRTGVAGISSSSITTSYSGRAIQSVDCITVAASPVDASCWITASTNNGGNVLRGRLTYLWYTDAACTTPHATSQTSGTGVAVPEGSYVEVTASEAPPDATAGYFKVRIEVLDDNGGANTNDDWCADDVVVAQ